eukprot:g361.t1
MFTAYNGLPNAQMNSVQAIMADVNAYQQQQQLTRLRHQPATTKNSRSDSKPKRKRKRTKPALDPVKRQKSHLASKTNSPHQSALKIWQGAKVRTKDYGICTVLSCRGNGALVIELSPDASEKANVKIRKRKRKSKDTVADGSEDVDSAHTSHKESENGRKAKNANSKSARRTVQPSKVVFEDPFLNSLNLMNDMQVIGGDPKRTSTSPAWRQLKHNSKILTALGVAELSNCNPTTQSISARLPFGGIIHIPLRTVLSSMLRFSYGIATSSNEYLQNSKLNRLSTIESAQMAIEIAQNKLEKTFKQREEAIAANTARLKNSASTLMKNGSRKRAKPSKSPRAAKKKADGSGLSASTVAPSLPIRCKKVNRGKVRKDKKELICDVCKKTFRLQHNLRAHKRTHTGEQPFQCKFPGCGKRFNHGGNLLKHERRHIPYEQRPYPCDVPGCGKRFMEACDLRTHKKGHTMKRSSYRGVTIERGRWKAQIGYGGKTHHIGTFDTDVDAAKAYDSEALRVHGKKALLNFPKKGQAGQIGTRKAPPRGKANIRQGRNYGKLISVKSAPKSE